MTDPIDDDIDALLRDAFDGPVPVGDFCDRVMARLPARRPAYRWPLAAGVLAGVAACGFSLWSAPIASAGLRDWLSGDMSASALALFASMMSMAMLALAWTLAEADGRFEAPARRVLR